METLKDCYKLIVDQEIRYYIIIKKDGLLWVIDFNNWFTIRSTDFEIIEKNF